MSDQSQTVEVLIKTVAELEGAKNAVASLERQAGVAKITGKDYAALEAKIAKAKEVIAQFEKQQATATAETAKAAAAIKTVQEAQTASSSETEKGSEKTKLFGEHLKEVKKAVHEMGESFPIAAFAFKAFTNPIGAALTIAISLFAKVKEHIAEVNKELDALGDRAKQGFGNLKEALVDAAREIAASSSTAAKALEKLSAQEADIKAKADAATEAIRRQERAQIALTDAIEAQLLAEVDAKRNLHEADPTKGLDDASAAKQETAIKLEAEKRRIAIQNAADNRALGAKQDLLGNDAVQYNKLRKVLDPLEQNRTNRDAKLGPNGLPAILSGLETERSGKSEEITKAMAERDKTSDAYQKQKYAHETFGMLTDTDIEASKKEAEEAQAKVEALTQDQGRISRAIKQAKEEQARLAQEKEDYSKADTATKALKDKMDALAKEIENLTKANKDEAQLRAQLFALKSGTANTSLAGQLIADAQKNGPQPGTLPPGVIVGPNGQLTVDPKAMPGYVAPPVAPRPHSTFPDFNTPPELSPEEVERRGGNPASVTRSHRDIDTKQHVDSIARSSEEIAQTMVQVVRDIAEGHDSLHRSVAALGQLVERQARQSKILESRINNNRPY